MGDSVRSCVEYSSARPLWWLGGRDAYPLTPRHHWWRGGYAGGNAPVILGSARVWTEEQRDTVETRGGGTLAMTI